MRVVGVKKPRKKLVEVVVKEKEEKELIVVVDGREGGEFEVAIRVIHVGEGGQARVRFRGVVAKGARLKAEGMIKIEKGGQEVESFLDMRGLILDDESMIEINPQLEIEANEVRASHAASVSQIDEEILEFLGSMGINRERGKKMVVNGFLLANELKKVDIIIKTKDSN